LCSSLVSVVIIIDLCPECNRQNKQKEGNFRGEDCAKSRRMGAGKHRWIHQRAGDQAERVIPQAQAASDSPQRSVNSSRIAAQPQLAARKWIPAGRLVVANRRLS